MSASSIEGLAQQPFSSPQAAQPAFSAPQSAAGPYEQALDQTVEATALAGSAAIRRIIAERNELMRERERLLGVIQELRGENDKSKNVGEQYRQVATELLIQLKQMHQAIQDASRTVRQLVDPTEERDSELLSLARRLAASGGGVIDQL
jgi:nitrogenase subunit NifH